MLIKKAYTIQGRTSLTIDTVADLGCDMGAKKININSNGSSLLHTPSVNCLKIIEGCNKFEFPIINGTSPSRFTICGNPDETLSFEFIIEEFGGKANPNYFKENCK